MDVKINKIRKRLGEYRAKLRHSFRLDEYRLALLQLLRCVDHETYLNYIYERAGKERPNSDALQEVNRLFGWGLNEALLMFWRRHTGPAGIPLFRSSQEMKRWGDSLLQCCGRVRFIEHMLELARIRLGEITASSEEEGVYEFYYSEDATGVESIERKDAGYFRVLLERMQRKDGVWEKLAKRRPAILSKMKRLVGVCERYYIRYDALPEVDDFYLDISAATALAYTGWDAFAPDAMFGGIPFEKYVSCTRTLMSFAHKHLDFCTILCTRNSDVDPINVTALPCKWSNACDSMSYALGISESQAAQVMATTCVTSENATHHLHIPAGPIAPHYMIGEGFAVRCITGCLQNPFEFMLRELRRLYPQDWDRSVGNREHMFREHLIALFAKFNRIVFFTDNIRIRTEIGDTDIDAFAFDPLHKIAGLFQLKWQDFFGSSMRERESRKRNFLKEGNTWVSKVSRWIDDHKMPRTLISLGMPKAIANDINETRLFVIGRHFSHFSGPSHMDDRAAWGTWHQLLRLVETKAQGNSPLTILYELLKVDSPRKRAQYPPTHEINIEGLKIIAYQPSSQAERPSTPPLAD